MYCPLRTFLLERREAATRVTQTARQLAAKAQESGAAAQKAQGEDAASEATRAAVAQASRTKPRRRLRLKPRAKPPSLSRAPRR